MNAAVRDFFSDKSNRDDRRGAHAHIRVEAWRLRSGE
jgi:hypothetical protein